MPETSKAATRISPKEAWKMMQSDPAVTLIDVRSDMEFLMIGHPKGAINVPWIDAPNWTADEAFVANVRRALLGRVSAANRQSHAVLLICRSGNRSLDAASVLTEQGLQNIHVIAGGFEGPLDDFHHRNSVSGWRFEVLPWEQC